MAKSLQIHADLPSGLKLLLLNVRFVNNKITLNQDLILEICAKLACINQTGMDKAGGVSLSYVQQVC